MDEQSNQPGRRDTGTSWSGVGLALGVALGVAIGTATGNLAVWIGVGAAIGITLAGRLPGSGCLPGKSE